ncbi:MAG: glycosyltransferase [Desulfovibrio sp.]|jgi:GT2 family glycosyltransferase|nr:glycosyltransferase [Desulfovibrio sp.]
MNTLQQILLPNGFLENYPEFFVRKHIYSALDESNGCSHEIVEYSHNTYMNIFQGKNFFTYCAIKDLFLKFEGTGRATVRIIGSNFDNSHEICDTILVEFEFYSTGLYSQYIAVPHPEQFTCIYFTVNYATKQNDEFIFKSAAWTTNSQPLRQVTMSCIICTYKREDYIKTNKQQFCNLCEENSDLAKRLHLFIIDNGRTLDKNESVRENISIHHNINAGGAGGFTRGMLETNRSAKKFDHILLMDDDVIIYPEAIKRTLTVIDYLRPEFHDSFIGGAMFNMRKPSLFWEKCAVRDEMWVKNPLKNNLDVCDLAIGYKNIVEISEQMDTDSLRKTYGNINSAWFYCAFPYKFIENSGLPLPFFIRGDDVEWGWRNIYPIINMNGISIWHEPFDFRVTNSSDCYYLIRNMFINNAVYVKNFKYSFAKMFIQKFRYLLKTYNYAGLAMLLKAMDDIIHGSISLKRNPEEILQELKNLETLHQPRSHFDVLPDHLDLACFMPTLSKFEQFVYRWTRYGLLLPNFLFEPYGQTFEPSTLVDDPRPFMFKKQVKCFNPVTHLYHERIFSRKKQLLATIKFYWKLFIIICRYNSLKRNFEQGMQEFRTVEFWETYLQLRPSPRNDTYMTFKQ